MSASVNAMVTITAYGQSVTHEISAELKAGDHIGEKAVQAAVSAAMKADWKYRLNR
jgi:hypothetical protein